MLEIRIGGTVGPVARRGPRRGGANALRWQIQRPQGWPVRDAIAGGKLRSRSEAEDWPDLVPRAPRARALGGPGGGDGRDQAADRQVTSEPVSRPCGSARRHDCRPRFVPGAGKNRDKLTKLLRHLGLGLVFSCSGCIL